MVFIESPVFTEDVVGQAQIRMILIYRKGTKDDLTPREKAVLRKMNAEW